MRLIEYPDAEMMMMDLADVLASELTACLMTHDRATFCVPGGTTPGPVFDTLSGVHLDWERVTVVPSDERWVDRDSPRLNARLICERLLVGPAASAAFFPLHGDGEPEAALPERIAALEPLLPISVLLLGMGADMHTASLFPGAAGLDAALEDRAPALAITAPEGQPERRVTLTAPVLSGALSTHIVVTGAEKRDALSRAKDLPVSQAPVKAVLGSSTVHWAP